MIIRVHRTHSHVRRSTASAMLTVDATSINTRTAYAEAYYNGAVSVRLSLPGQRARQKQSNGLCNSFHYLGHPKMSMMMMTMMMKAVVVCIWHVGRENFGPTVRRSNMILLGYICQFIVLKQAN